MGYNTFQPIVTNGLTYYADFMNTKSYPGTGTSLTDLQNRSVGTLFNTPTFTNNKMLFDGVSDYATTGFAFNPNTSSFSVVLWCSLASGATFTSSSNLYCIFSTNSTSANNGIFILYRGGTNGFLVCPDFTGTKQVYPSIDVSSLVKISMQQVCITRESGVLNIYFNGSLIGTSSSVASWNFGSTGTNAYFARTSNGLYDANVYIGECMIYNRALSSTEVLQNYNASKWKQT